MIDDDEINRGILENLFSPVYAVEEAENGKEGLRKILQDPDRYRADPSGCDDARNGWNGGAAASRKGRASEEDPRVLDYSGNQRMPLCGKRMIWALWM